MTTECRQTVQDRRPAAEPGLLVRLLHLAPADARLRRLRQPSRAAASATRALFDAAHRADSNFVHYGNGFLDNEEAPPRPRRRPGRRPQRVGHRPWPSMDIDPGRGASRRDTAPGGPAAHVLGRRRRPQRGHGDPRGAGPRPLPERRSLPRRRRRLRPVHPFGRARLPPDLQTRDGMLFLIFDRFRSMDGAAHELDLHWFQAFRNPGGADEPGFQFPWTGDAYATHNDGDTIPGTADVPRRDVHEVQQRQARRRPALPQGLVMFDRPVGPAHFNDDADFIVPTTALGPGRRRDDGQARVRGSARPARSSSTSRRRSRTGGSPRPSRSRRRRRARR